MSCPPGHKGLFVCHALSVSSCLCDSRFMGDKGQTVSILGKQGDPLCEIIVKLVQLGFDIHGNHNDCHSCARWVQQSSA